MKKFLAMILTALAITVGGLTAPAAANAVESANVQTISSVSTVVPASVGTAVTINQSAGVAIQTRVNISMWRYVSCYLAMNGATYCWRYACTYFEKVALGCYDGWYRTTMWYA